jgi:hypothetical protein
MRHSDESGNPVSPALKKAFGAKKAPAVPFASLSRETALTIKTASSPRFLNLNTESSAKLKKTL